MLKFHPSEFVDKAGHTVKLDPITILEYRPIKGSSSFVSFKITYSYEVLSENEDDFQDEIQDIWEEYAMDKKDDKLLTEDVKRLKYFLRDKATVLENGERIIIDY